MRELRERSKPVSYAEGKENLDDFLVDDDEDHVVVEEEDGASDGDEGDAVMGRKGTRRQQVQRRSKADPQAGALRRFVQEGVDNTASLAPEKPSRATRTAKRGTKKARKAPEEEEEEDGASDGDEDFQGRGRSTRGRRNKNTAAPAAAPAQPRREAPKRRAAAKAAVVEVDEDDISASDNSGDDGEEEEEEEEEEAGAQAVAEAGSDDDDGEEDEEEEEEDDDDDEEEEEERPPKRSQKAKAQRSPARRQPSRSSRRTAVVVESSESEDEAMEPVKIESRTERASRRRGVEKKEEKKEEKEEEHEKENEEDEESGSSGDEEEDEDEDEEEDEGLIGEIQQILAVKEEDEEQRVLVKYKGLSHHENNWVSAKEVYEERKQLLQNFMQKFGVTGEFEDENGFANGVNPDWLRIERVFGARTRRGKQEYLVKWGSLGYAESTWEPSSWVAKANKEAIKQFRAYDTPKRAAQKLSCSKRRRASDEIPEFLNGRKLRDYQEISLRWNMANWVQRRNCILGDEMGLGKTAQSISVLEAQRQAGHPGPFLVVAPLTTLGHWKREIETWTSMTCVLYSGTQVDRKIIQDFEMKVPQSKGNGNRKVLGSRFDVLLTSYENLRMDQNFLQRLWFQSAIVDEAHRLKSTTALARRAIEAMDIGWLLLLTGTPIQNNLQELFGLMNLLDEERYPALNEFCERFGADGTPTPEQIGDLQECLKPILLRRMKEDVETLPEKEEVIIWVELTREQRMYYKALYGRDIGTLLGGAVGKNIPGLRNLAMELRKVCCHPYLCNGLEQDITSRESGQSRTELDNMVAASGKMMLLHKLLPKLKAEGHKVLIFSQFCIMLNVLEDYLRLCGHATERIDGSTSGTERQASIDRFCKDGSNSFVFLLSTKAGGQGITLTAADTVIIYDSDWNPQNDLQAMARCHRIGQEREVKIYRLLSRDTYEEAVFNASSRKYGLDEAVLGNMGPKGAASDPEQDRKRIMELLKNGAHSLVPSDGQAMDGSDNAFAKEDIDQILSSRTEKRQIGNRAGNTFSVATFVTTTEEDPTDGSGSWEELLPEAVAAHAETLKAAKAATLAGAAGPRVRKRINYREQLEGGRARASSPSSDDSEDGEDGEGRHGNTRVEGSSDVEVVEEFEGGAAGGRKRRKKKEPKEPKPPPVKHWLKRELKALVDALVHLGEGRTEQVRLVAGLDGNRTLEQVKEVEAAVLRLIAMKASSGPSAAPAAPSPAPAVDSSAPQQEPTDEAKVAEQQEATAAPVRAEGGPEVPAQAPPAAVPTAAAPGAPAAADLEKFPVAAAAVLTGPYFTKLLEASAASWTDQLKQRKALAALVRPTPEASGGSSPQQHQQQQQPKASGINLFAPRLKARPAKLPYWWNRLADTTLLAGCHKHGCSNRTGLQTAVAILTDPELGFASAFAPGPQPQQQPMPQDVGNVASAAAPVAPVTTESGCGNAGGAPCATEEAPAPAPPAEAKTGDASLEAVPSLDAELKMDPATDPSSCCTDPAAPKATLEAAASTDAPLVPTSSTNAPIDPPPAFAAAAPEAALEAFASVTAPLVPVPHAEVYKASAAAPVPPSPKAIMCPEDAEVVAQLGKAMAAKIKAVMSAEMPNVTLPELKSPANWTTLVTSTAQRLKALLKAVATGEGIAAPLSQVLTKKRPAEGREKSPVFPSYAGAIGQDIRAMVLARMNSSGSGPLAPKVPAACPPRAAPAAAPEDPIEIDDDFAAPSSRAMQPQPSAPAAPLPEPIPVVDLVAAEAAAAIAAPATRPAPLSIKPAAGSGSVVDLLSSDGSVSDGPGAVTSSGSVIDLTAADNPEAAAAPPAAVVAKRCPLGVIENCPAGKPEQQHPMAVKQVAAAPKDPSGLVPKPRPAEQELTQPALKKKKGSIASFFERQRMQASAAQQEQQQAL